MLTYELIDPRNGHTRYIGKTTLGISKRLTRHMWEHDKSGGPLYNWIKQLVATKEKPIIRVVYDGDCEKELIEWIIRSGGRLLNQQHVKFR